jgi:glycerol-3-phosphate dehydrogenase
MRINDLMGIDLNRSNGTNLSIPPGRVVSKEECLKIFSGFDRVNLTGGAIWHDCQVYNSERLVLSFLLSAKKQGAVVANYTKVKGLIFEGRQVTGVRAVDLLTGNEVELRARVVLNSTGPWVHDVISDLEGLVHPLSPKENLALGLNLITGKSICDTGIGVRSKRNKRRDPIGGGNRFLFFVPWREYTLIGTSYKPFSGTPENCIVREEDIQDLLDECNEACPEARLSIEDVSFCHKGLLPLRNTRKSSRKPSLAKKHWIVDHSREQGISGLISVIGVKYTMARSLAEETIDLVYKNMGYSSPTLCRTRETPIYGGERQSLSISTDSREYKIWKRLSNPVRNQLQRNYGSRLGEILVYAKEDPGWVEPIAKASPILHSQVLHAVRAEMAMKLTDVVFRRTEMGSARCPPRSHLETASKIMAKELGWNQSQRSREFYEVLSGYSPLSTWNRD